MKEILKVIGTLAAFLVFQGAMAQNITISGTITDADTGEPLPGINVVQQGTSNGTSADFDGNYTISAPSNATLIFTGLGFATQNVAVNGRSTINVQLTMSSESLDEVVVTALGLERSRKALGYAVTELDGESLSEVKTTSPLNALQGKIAGVNITPPATGAAGSSRVIIRGASSLSGANQPLYVVDGVTIDNSQLGAASQWGGSDFGDGVSSLNPDDIQSVSVLKGGAAGALYGSRAANGVIIITTKNGRQQDGFGVEFSSQVTFDAINNDVQDFQREYGQGSQGIAPTSVDEALNTAFSSWGSRLGNGNSVQYDGVSRSYSDQGNNLDRFYRTGNTLINSVAVSNAGENFNYRFGVTNLDNKDIVPNSNLNRKTFSLNLGAIQNEKLSVDLSARYTIEKVNNRPRVSDSPGNPNYSVALLPANMNVETFQPGFTEDGTEDQISSNPFVQNPYWAAERFRTFDRRNQFLGSATIKYNILDWLYVTARAGIDQSSIRTTQIEGYGTAYNPLGAINETQRNLTQVDADIILGAKRQITPDLGIDAIVGANKNTQRQDFLFLRGERFVIPFLEILGNVENASRSRTLSELAFSGIYGSIELNYKDYLFLTVTGRNDWFSTLSADGKDTPNNDFYPSVSGSFVFSNVFEMPEWVSFGKIRANYSEVAGGAETPYQLSLPYAIFGQGHLGQPLGRIDTGTVPNTALTPFSKEEIEIGFDVSFLDNRLALDLAYYQNTTTRDILNVNISNASGFNNVLSNVGELENKGVELLISGVPIRTQDFQWSANFNMTFNESLVVATDPDGNDLTVGDVRTFAANITQRPGNPFGVILGTAYLRNDSGDIVYGADGLPVINPERQILGEGVPPWTLGLTNTFRYKNFGLSFLIDGKFGGDVYAGTNALAYSNGLHQATLEGRGTGLTVNGVDEAGAAFSFTHDDTTLQSYYGRLGSIAETVVQSADFLKLRQLSFSYNVPGSLLDGTFIESASVSIVGRDLFFLYRAADNIDPESGFNAGNAQGLEYFGLPPIRSYGLTFNLKF